MRFTRTNAFSHRRARRAEAGATLSGQFIRHLTDAAESAPPSVNKKARLKDDFARCRPLASGDWGTLQTASAITVTPMRSALSELACRPHRWNPVECGVRRSSENSIARGLDPVRDVEQGEPGWPPWFAERHRNTLGFAERQPSPGGLANRHRLTPVGH